MSKKCFISLICFAAFEAIVLGAAYATASINVPNAWTGMGIGLSVLVIFVVLGILLPKNPAVCFFMYVFDAAGCGIAVSSLFYAFGTPSAGQAALVLFSPVLWYFIFCIFTNLDFCKGHCKFCVFVWLLLLAGAAVVCVIFMDGTLGWLALPALFPSVIFIFGLILSAECASEHFCNQTFAFAIILIVLFIAVTALLHGNTSFDSRPEFSSGSDDPFGFE